jgi:hypothetical protein
MRALLVPVFLATACSSPRKAANAPAASTKDYPAALYAGLFQKDARYTYTLDVSHSQWDDDANRNVEEHYSGSMTCTVTDVRELPSAIASNLDCEDDSTVTVVGDGPAGIYVATADGLWRVPEMPRVAPTSRKQRLFAWPPVASETDDPDPLNPGGGSKVTVSRNGARGWCRYLTFISGDEGDEGICVADGIIVAGSASSEGGDSHEMTYNLTKP